MKNIDILNDEKYIEYRELFRKQCIKKYPATEIALIDRYLFYDEKTLTPGKDFSIENLKLIELLINML